LNEKFGFLSVPGTYRSRSAPAAGRAAEDLGSVRNIDVSIRGFEGCSKSFPLEVEALSRQSNQRG
jgi:hypothetical protein